MPTLYDDALHKSPHIVKGKCKCNCDECTDGKYCVCSDCNCGEPYKKDQGH